MLFLSKIAISGCSIALAYYIFELSLKGGDYELQEIERCKETWRQEKAKGRICAKNFCKKIKKEVKKIQEKVSQM